MKIKMMGDEIKILSFSGLGCLLLFVLIGACIGAMAGVAVAVFRAIAG